MSFATWKAEFYPITAEEAANESPEAALAHSIQKWRGRLSHNRAKHGVVQSNKYMVFAHGEEDSLMYNAGTCALCKYYLRDYSNTDCNDCPIVVNGDIGCGYEGSAYDRAITYPSDTNIRTLISCMTGKEEPIEEQSMDDRANPPYGQSHDLATAISSVSDKGGMS